MDVSFRANRQATPPGVNPQQTPPPPKLCLFEAIGTVTIGILIGSCSLRMAKSISSSTEAMQICALCTPIFCARKLWRTVEPHINSSLNSISSFMGMTVTGSIGAIGTFKVIELITDSTLAMQVNSLFALILGGKLIYDYKLASVVKRSDPRLKVLGLIGVGTGLVKFTLFHFDPKLDAKPDVILALGGYMIYKFWTAHWYARDGNKGTKSISPPPITPQNHKPQPPPITPQSQEPPPPPYEEDPIPSAPAFPIPSAPLKNT